MATTGDTIDLDELTRLALAGDPDAPLPADAVPWQGSEPDADGHSVLPDWYMPRPTVGASRVSGWRRFVAWTIIVASLAVVASGLCNTYGYLEIA